MSNYSPIKHVFIFLLTFFIFGDCLSQQMILLQPIQIVSETGIGMPERLVDEPWAFEKYTKGEHSVPTSVWSPGYNKLYFPSAAVIDLKGNYEINEIMLFDGEGLGLVEFYTGEPGDWKFLFSNSLDQYNVWRKHSMNVRTKYLRIVLSSSAAPIELALFGTLISKSEVKESKISTPNLPKQSMDKWLGINGFIDDPIDKLQCAGIVREYHNWKWNMTALPFNPLQLQPQPNSQHVIKLNPSYPGWDFDGFYTNIQHAGLETVVCVQNSVPWLSLKNSGKPVQVPAKLEDPASYVAHGAFMYQYAARYGTKKIIDSALKLGQGQPVVSGLGLINYYENWNEPDRWWENRESYFRPFEFAAMCSADYDGHVGRLGKNVGVKNADKTALMVMGGLIKLDTAYLAAMKLWAKAHRAGSFPADIISVHYYPENPNYEALSPEKDHMRQKFADFKRFCHQNFPGKPVWVSEFGYDTDPNSKKKCPSIGTVSALEVQAQWLVRASLEAAASGLDRFFIYMLRNVADQGGEQYLTSGVTSSKDSHHVPKIAWYYMSCFKTILKGKYFYRDISTEKVRIYMFTDKKSKQCVLAIWSPTDIEISIPDFKVTLKFNVRNALVANLSKGSPVPSYSTLKLEDGGKSFHTSVSETPVFIMLDIKD